MSTKTPLKLAVAILFPLALGAAACLPQTGDPGVFLWVTNETASVVRVEYVQSAGNRVYMLQPRSSGRLNTFPAPESANRITVADEDCRGFAEADVPSSGAYRVIVSGIQVRVEPITDQEWDFTAPLLPAASPCPSP